MIDIEEIKKINCAEKLVLTEHGRVRLIERGITIDDVVACIENGEIIEQYEDDKPFPSCLVLGMAINHKYIHAVVSSDKEFIYLITAYIPDIEIFGDDLKTRKERKK